MRGREGKRERERERAKRILILYITYYKSAVEGVMEKTL